uniref:Uncharacterized protein n=1 Tax=Alexandrium catenella TaxID=2925 RepID=A0A7S1SEN9_ALECA
MAKALEMCDDDELLGEMTQHSLRLDALERHQKDKQKKQFKGFWDKLQDRGGYIERRAEKDAQRKAEWDNLNYEDKFYKIQELDDSEDEDDDAMPPMYNSAPQGNAAQNDAFQADLEEYLRQSLPGARVDSAAADVQRARQEGLDQGFDAYWEQKGQEDEMGAGVGAARRRQPAQAWSSPSADGQAQQRPQRSEELPLRWAPGAEPRAEQAMGPEDAAEAWARRQEEAARKERRWRMDYEKRQRDEREDEDLREARERLRQQEQQKAAQRVRRRMDALDNSDDD